MNDIQLRRIGLDPGFGSVKVAEVQDQSIASYVLPSTVGLRAPTESGLSLAGVVRPQRRERRPFRVAFDGVEYLVGSNVADFTRPIDRMDFDRFTNSPELRATLYAALYQILNGGAHRLDLVIALPVEVLQDKAEAGWVEQAMRAWLVGEHTFSVDGVESALIVADLRARVPQPVASWFDWGMDLAGQWVKGPEAVQAPTLIIDEGFNTLDVLITEGSKIISRYTGGGTLGMRRAAERLGNLLAQRYGVSLELQAADDLVRQAVSGQKVVTYVEGDAVDVSPEARQALRSLEADVVAFVERSVGQGREHRVLLTGGGALALAPRLLRLFPRAVVMHEPILANARGLAKLAVRPGFLK